MSPGFRSNLIIILAAMACCLPLSCHHSISKRSIDQLAKSMGNSSDVGKMLPKDPVVFVGETFKLCCYNMESDERAIEIEYATFYHNGTKSSLISQPYLVIGQDRDEICANITVYSTKQRGLYECKYPPAETMAMQIVSVYDPPVADEKISCFLYDDENFNCTWVPKKLDNPNVQVTVEISFIVADSRCSSNGSVKTVTCHVNPPCELPLRDINFFCSYNISMTVTYKVQSHDPVVSQSQWKTFEVLSVVKYGKLDVDVKAMNANANCIVLEFSKIFDSDVIIRVSYTSQWESHRVYSSDFTLAKKPFQPLLSLLNSTRPLLNEKVLCGFTPHTQYKINVSVQAEESSLWSDPRKLTVTTSEDAPERPPATVPGAFHLSDDSNTAFIYWQSLTDKEWQCDEASRSFQLSRMNLSGHWIQLKFVNGNVIQTDIPLYETGDTVIKLHSLNDIGLSKNYSQLTIPAIEKRISPPTIVTAVVNRLEKVVSLSWTSEFIEKVVIFWCTSVEKNKCYDGKIDWTIITNNLANSVDLPIPTSSPEQRYMFGVSVAHSSLFSSITWTTCSEKISDGKTRYASNCRRPEDTGTGDDVTILAIGITGSVVFVAALTIGCIVWCKSRYRHNNKELSSEKLYRGPEVIDDLIGKDNEDAPAPKSSSKSWEKGNKVKESNGKSNDGFETDSYHKFVGFTTPNNNITNINALRKDVNTLRHTVTEIRNRNDASDDESTNYQVTSDRDSGDVSHYGSGNIDHSENTESGDVPHCTSGNIDHLENTDSVVVPYCTSGNIDHSDNTDSRDVPHYTSGNIGHSENTDSRDVPHCTSGNIDHLENTDSVVVPYCTSGNIDHSDNTESGDVPHNTSGNIDHSENTDSRDVPHYTSGNIDHSENTDSGDVPHYTSGNIGHSENTDSGDVPHYTSGNIDHSENTDSGDVPHYGSGNIGHSENTDSGDVPHYTSGNIGHSENTDSGDVPHYTSGNIDHSENTDSGDVPHYTSGNIDHLENTDSGDVPHYTSGNIDHLENTDSGDVPHYTSGNIGHSENTDSGDVPHYTSGNIGHSENTDSGDVPHYTSGNIDHSENTDSGDVPHYTSGNIDHSENTDSGDVPHYTSGNIDHSENTDSGDVPHDGSGNIDHSDNTESGDDPRYTSGNIVQYRQWGCSSLRL